MRSGIPLLSRFRIEPEPNRIAGILSDMALYAARDGQQEASLTTAARAFRVAEQSENAIERYLRRCDFARHLRDGLRPALALRVLPDMGQGHPHDRVRLTLLQAKAHVQAGNRAEAHDWLHRAYAMMGFYSPEMMKFHSLWAKRREADSLSLRL